ncbi:hypothetical protein pipiens_020446, partial [Culex pipiens pipiens]
GKSLIFRTLSATVGTPIGACFFRWRSWNFSTRFRASVSFSFPSEL